MVALPEPSTILVVDDEEAIRSLMRRTFTSYGYRVATAENGASALDAVTVEQPALVLLDLHMPGLSGLEVIEELKTRHPQLPVVMLTGTHDVSTAVRAIKLGALDYVTKPIAPDDLLRVVQRSLETHSLRLEVQALRRDAGQRLTETLSYQMGPSALVRQVIDQVGLVAASTFTVLVVGETGTGKELVAKAIHELSDRRRRPFVALDCGAIPEPLLESELFGHEKGAFTGAERRRAGRFRLAEGGTCFLDEVGNLPMSLQAKLLRVLESRELQPVGAERSLPIDVRFVAATNEDLQQRVARGLFRADLYFRLAQYTVVLPVLRRRPEDLAHLTRRFVDEASIELRRPIQSITEDALRRLQQHAWPGNVRELRNVVRQAVLQTSGLAIRAETIEAVLGGQQLSSAAGGAEPVADGSLREVALAAAARAERSLITDTLTRTKGNKSLAAKLLKTDYKTLHTKLKALGIRAADFRP